MQKANAGKVCEKGLGKVAKQKFKFIFFTLQLVVAFAQKLLQDSSKFYLKLHYEFPAVWVSGWATTISQNLTFCWCITLKFVLVNINCDFTSGHFTPLAHVALIENKIAFVLYDNHEKNWVKTSNRLGRKVKIESLSKIDFN